MEGLAPIIKEIVVDYMTKVVMENGLGSMEEYNITIESITEKEIKLSMFIDELSEGLNLPLYDYAVNIGLNNFQSDMNTYINNQTTKFLKTKTQTTINITLFRLTININQVPISPNVQVDVTSQDISVLQP